MTSVKTESDQIQTLPIDAPANVRDMRHLPKEQVEHARRIFKETLKSRFGNNKSAMHRELGISQPAISEIASGNSGMSLKTIESLAKLIGMTPDEVRGLKGKTTTTINDLAIPSVIAEDEGLHRAVVVAVEDLQLPHEAVQDVLGRFERRRVPLTPKALLKAFLAESELFESGVGLPGEAITSANSKEIVPDWGEKPKKLR